MIFPDRTIAEILARRPSSPAELAAIHGLGPARLERFGRELYGVVKEALALGASQSVERHAPAERVAASGRPAPAERSGPVNARTAVTAASSDHKTEGIYQALATWRRDRARTEDVPPFHVFANRVLDEIARTRPGTHEELAAVPGVGPVKLERYGDEVLEVVAAG